MSEATAAALGRPHTQAAPRRSISLRRLQRAALWLFVFAGAFVFIEPSPYEFLFPIAFIATALAGLRLPARGAPLVLLLTLFNIGGAFSLIPYLDDEKSVTFVLISIYLGFTAIYFAALMTEEAAGRLAVIRSALIWSAWVTGLAGVLGYFNIAGLGDHFTEYGRASGTFKDPNVFGPYLVLPIIYVVQSFLERRTGFVRTLIVLSIPLAALFLSFSRGAWADLVGALVLLFGLTFMTSPRPAIRLRVILYAGVCVVALAALLAVALSVDTIRQIFEERATLSQSYDLGVTGRFGNQLRSIPLLLGDINGFGPLRFHVHFGADPHNVYINAFASYGWLGGLSYLALIVATWVVGWRTVFRRGPLQTHAIALWSALAPMTIQGYQIDTDHWRHFYLLLGLVWGIAATSQFAPSARPARRPQTFPSPYPALPPPSPKS
jgi:O-antigen ligase